MKAKTAAVVGAPVAVAVGAALMLMAPEPKIAPESNIYQVTNLNDSGAGSFRNGVLNRQGPRDIHFKVGGTIVMKSPIKIELPYLTIDGSTAPAPGITLEIPQLGIGNSPEIKIGATHDIIIHGLRFDGDWDPGEFVKNDGTFSVDGDAGPSVQAWDPNPYACDPSPQTPGSLYLRNACRIVIDQNTFTGAADSGPDFWCGVKDLTFSRNFVLDSFSPRSTGCDTIGKPGDSKSRERLTIYQNVFAYNGARNTKWLEGVYDVDVIDNIYAFWQDYATGVGGNQPGPDGYAIIIDDDGGQDKHNYVNNMFLPGRGDQPKLCAADDDDCTGSDRCREKRDCIFGDSCKPDAEDLLLAKGFFFAGNSFAPKHNPAECVSTATGQVQFVRPYNLTVLPLTQLETVLDAAGVQHRTARENAVIADVRTDLRARLGQ